MDRFSPRRPGAKIHSIVGAVEYVWNVDPVRTQSQTQALPSTLRWLVHGVIVVLVGFVLLTTYVGIGTREPGIPRASAEMSNLQTAINQFNLEYGCFPVSEATAEHCRDIGTDVTFGMPFSLRLPHVALGNAELMDLLMAREAGPRRELRNPRRIKFMDLKMARSTNDSGLGPDGCYRDPWGNPYVISLDLDGDGYCADAVYSRPEVAIDAKTEKPFDSQLMTKNESDRVRWQTRILIWSCGPDGKADRNISATEGVNADNILSWE